MGSKVAIHTNHTSIIYLMAKNEAKSRLIRWILFLQEFEFEVNDQKWCEIKFLTIFPTLNQILGAMSLSQTLWYTNFPNYIMCVVVLEAGIEGENSCLI